MLRYNYTNDGGARQISVILNGRPVIVDDSHANFSAVLNACRAGDEAAAYKFLDFDAAYREALSAIDARFSIVEGKVTFDGEAISDNLNSAIVSVLTEKGDVKPLANFVRLLDGNPSFRSRTQLWAWIKNHGLNINDDGYLIAYKGVKPNESGDYVSIHSGDGIVNGKATSGYLRNNVGDVVEVPRHKVDDDPNSTCSFGLHAGTYDYANNFGQGITLTVKINPADVVSVPRDGHKIRACRYEVLATTESAWTATVVWDGVSDSVDSDWSDDQEDDYWSN